MDWTRLATAIGLLVGGVGGFLFLLLGLSWLEDRHPGTSLIIMVIVVMVPVVALIYMALGG